VQWETPTGLTVHGLLLLPPDYDAGKKYPLVIQTKPEFGQFLCDAGQDHYPSFAPEPIANADMLYLIRSLPDSKAEKNDVEYFPKGYPGQLGEAAFHLALWDSAVAMLAAKGIINPDKLASSVSAAPAGTQSSF